MNDHYRDRRRRRAAVVSTRWRRIAAIALSAALVALVVGVVRAPMSSDPQFTPALCPNHDRSTTVLDPNHEVSGAAGHSESTTEDAVTAPAPLWADNFDAPEGTAPEPSRWLMETGGLGWGDGTELQAYTNLTSNVAHNGEGQLVITARAQPGAGGARFTSARISTCGTFEFNHGRVEARIKIPRGQGLWPAFWLVGAKGHWPHEGEIDIFEGVNAMHKVSFNTHQPRRDGSDWRLPSSSPVHPTGSWANDYHTYAVDWTSNSISWSVDGTVYWTVERAYTPPDGSWVVDRAPQIIVLNLAVGGWPGAPDSSTRFPAEMKIDYVKVFENADTVVATRDGVGINRADANTR